MRTRNVSNYGLRGSSVIEINPTIIICNADNDLAGLGDLDPRREQYAKCRIAATVSKRRIRIKITQRRIDSYEFQQGLASEKQLTLRRE